MNFTWRAALVTPPGVAAIAVIAIRGAAELGSRLRLRMGNSIQECQIGAIHVADFHHGHSDSAEEVVFTRSGQDSFEIQCHGGYKAAESILHASRS